MNGEHLLNQTAIVTERGEQRDEDGNLVRDEYGNVQLVETTRKVAFWFEPLGADEVPPVAEQTGNGYLPAGDPIGAMAKITFEGTDFEVIGPAIRPINPRTGEPGLVLAALKRTTG